jgi:L-alanine-DL-glutamate epimerase-like enolase superfamily enzyme
VPEKAQSPPREDPTMKIERVAAYGVLLPQKVVYTTAVMSYSELQTVVTEVTLEGGATGVGQASISRAPYSAFGETLEGAVNAINNYLGPAIVGLEATAMEVVHRRMEAALTANPFAKTSIDIALHDAVGHALGIPVAALLGGPIVKEVPFLYSIGNFPTDELVDKAVEAVENGYTLLKLRVGIDQKTDVRNLAAVRERLGDDIHIGVDFNAGLQEAHGRPDKAIAWVRALERFNLDAIEQPVGAWDLEGLARVTAAIDTPIVADESMWSLHDAQRIISMHAADILKIKLIKTRGLHQARKIANLCESAGVPLVIGHGIAGVVQNAAEAHFAASVPGWKAPGEFNGFLKMKQDIAAPLTVVGHNIILTDAPGLGVDYQVSEAKSLKVA